MKPPRLIASTIALVLGTASSPVLAQGMDPSTPMNMPMPARSPPPRSSRKPKPAPAADHDMAAMGMDAMPPGMAMPPAATPTAPPPPSPTDAERAAAFAPVSPHPMHDDDVHAFTLVDRFESHGNAFEWEGATWIGSDLDRVWVRSEGRRENGRVEEADVEVLYGHSVATWWDVVAGLRHDFRPGAGRDFAALGLVGQAPGKFEVRATVYAGPTAQASLRLEAQRDLLLTNRLVLQPLVEVDAYDRDDAPRGIGSGLSTIEAGLRLRYEITRRFAPYIGIVREQAFGRTAGFRKAAGEDATATRLVAGLHFWF